MLLYLIVGISLFEFIYILLIVSKNKKQKIIATDAVARELDNCKALIKKLKKDLKNVSGDKQYLKDKIAKLELKIKLLEKANLELLKKKEQLAESKLKLEELQAQKDDLFAIAIHDIKNPVSAIKGYIELITSYDLNAQEQQEIMQNMMESSDQIVSLAQEISKLVAQQKPESFLTLEKTSIKRIIDSVCSQNNAYAQGKGIKIINKSSINTPETKLDPSKIEEVIDNLVNNAIKYGKENTSIYVSTFFTNENITVEISDNGVGLSDEDQAKAFEKGAKLTPKPTGDETSSGLGLWIVKKIVEEHNGSVWVKSKLGTGSTFGFKIPIK